MFAYAVFNEASFLFIVFRRKYLEYVYDIVKSSQYLLTVCYRLWVEQLVLWCLRAKISHKNGKEGNNKPPIVLLMLETGSSTNWSSKILGVCVW